MDPAALRQALHQKDLPTDLKERLSADLDRVEKAIRATGFKLEYDRELEYLSFILSLPFNESSQDILDLKRAREILESRHYGLAPVKERILEYLSVLILNSKRSQQLRSSVLAFVGLVGSGKTSLAYSIAESLGRKLIRIPFGGLGSVWELRGESRLKPEAEPGKILKFIAQARVDNPVILLDEIDRVAEAARSDVMGVLVELLDPEQNFAFIDHFVDFPFNLSKVLFIATANNTANIATAVLDRLEIIEMPSYTDDQKIVIAKSYLLPRAMEEAGLKENLVIIEETLWPQIVRPLGFDGGIRSLQRHVQTIVRRVAKRVVEGSPGPFQITAANISEYL